MKTDIHREAGTRGTIFKHVDLSLLPEGAHFQSAASKKGTTSRSLKYVKRFAFRFPLKLAQSRHTLFH